jgi:hypothetical protein
MTTVPVANQPDPPNRPTVPARALVPWLPLQAALTVASSTRLIDADTATSQWNTMQAAVSKRPRRVPTNAIVSDIPNALSDHIAQLVNSADFAPFAAEGWAPKLVNLREVIAAQPFVLRGDEPRLATLTGDDPVDVARHTLPIAGDTHLEVGVDNPGRPTFIKITSSDPNLRVMGFANAQPDGQPTAQIVGAVVGAPPSYMQVGNLDGRPILRDGYHRAVEFLERDIEIVPALVRDIDDIEQLFPAWQRPHLLPDQAWLGDRPPLLGDYLDDRYSAIVDIATSGKAIVVTIVEMPWP